VVGPLGGLPKKWAGGTKLGGFTFFFSPLFVKKASLLPLNGNNGLPPFPIFNPGGPLLGSEKDARVGTPGDEKWREAPPQEEISGGGDTPNPSGAQKGAGEEKTAPKKAS